VDGSLGPPRGLKGAKSDLQAWVFATGGAGGDRRRADRGAPGALAASPPPHYDHVVLAIFENKARSQIIGASSAPYLNNLAAQGANFTESFALRQPSQPNYLDLFSGSNHGLEGPTGNDCPQTFASGNLGHQLIASGRTFVGYAEDLPSAGSPVCNSGGADGYWRKHAPWTNFTNLNQTTVSRPYSAFPTDFTKLPTVSFVVPNQCNDMHNVPHCSVSTGDTWARHHLDAYAQWAKTHNSLLIVTWDEDDYSPGNLGCCDANPGGGHVATIVIANHGPHAVQYGGPANHYSLLQTVQDAFHLGCLRYTCDTANVKPLTPLFVPTG